MQAQKLMYIYWINCNITDIFTFWMDLFLIFLLVRFTREKFSMLKDRVLDRNVPNIVFINNTKLIKEACIKRME